MSNTVQIKVLPKFSGNKEDFLGYAIMFKAVANLKTFDDALQDTNKPRLGDLTQSKLMVGEDWNQIKEYYRQNKLAVTCLMLSMNPKKLGLINMINNTKTRMWPDGDAQAIWDDLYRRFVPKTALSRAQIRVELDN